jgi:adenosylcobinamide-GDP ribazoletransferase
LAPLPLLLPLDSAVQSIGLAAFSAAGGALAGRRLIGGFTGDVLGAVEQIAEVALLLGISARIAAL